MRLLQTIKQKRSKEMIFLTLCSHPLSYFPPAFRVSLVKTQLDLTKDYWRLHSFVHSEVPIINSFSIFSFLKIPSFAGSQNFTFVKVCGHNQHEVR